MSDRVLEIVRRPGCRLVRLDSGESMTVPLAVFKRQPLSAGQAVDPEAYRARALAVEKPLAMEHAGRMLSARDRTEHEISEKLRAVGYQEQTVAQILQRLTEARLVDDSRFLASYINMKIQRRGIMHIRRELRMKGIAPEAIDAALEEADGAGQLEAAVKHARKALSRKNDDPRHQARLAFAALARRGFRPEVARRAVETALSGPEQQEADGFPG